MAEKLYKAGAALEIYDPMAPNKLIIKDINSYWKTNTDKIEERISFLKTFSSFHGIAAVAILTEWEEFKNIDFQQLKVFDGRSLFKKAFYIIGA